MFASLWILSGLLAIVLLRRRWCFDFEESFWCLSPFGYLFLFLASSFGLLLLGAALLLLFVKNLVDGTWKNSWFFRPICKK